MSEKCRFRVVTAQESPPGQSSGEPKDDISTGSLAPIQLGVKRRYHDDSVVVHEELWSLHDVIFTDRVQSIRIGKVIKIDGLFAAVQFPVSNDNDDDVMDDGGGDERDGILERCRLLRKDDLVVSRLVTMTTVYHYVMFLVCSWQLTR